MIKEEERDIVYSKYLVRGSEKCHLTNKKRSNMIISIIFSKNGAIIINYLNNM